MFEPVEEQRSGIFPLTIRIVYLIGAAGVSLTCIYFALIPATTHAELLGRFVFGTLLLIVSVVMTVPIGIYVIWQWVKGGRPLFWGISVLVASIPLLMMLVTIVKSFR